MTLSNKKKILIVLIAPVLSFLAGYKFGHPGDVTEEKSKTETTTDVKDSTTTKKTKTVIVKQPDGTTRIERETDTIKREQEKQDKVVKEESKRVEGRTPKIHVGVLGGYNFRNSVPEYGLYVSKDVLGNVNLGLYGTNVGVVGVTIGVSF